MKRFRYVFFIILLAKAPHALAQTGADSVSATFPKVVFVNVTGDVLLAFDDRRKAYEVPANGFIEGPIAFRQYIDLLAKEIGITYDAYRLGGVFTYIFPGKYSTFIRPYFVVPITGYLNGQGIAGDSYKWFPLDDATNEIKYPASSKIVEKIIKNPDHVWCATFEEYGYTNPVDESKIRFRIIEDFHKID